MEGEYRTSGMQEIGTALRALREARGSSLREIADILQVSEATIAGYEEGSFQTVFTARVYARGFLIRLLGVLKVEPEERRMILRRFEEEWGVNGYDRMRDSHRGLGIHGNRWYLTPQRLGAGVAAVSFFILGTFVALRLTAFLGVPLLSIEEPRRDAVFLPESVLRVKGRAERESRLTVNGREIRIDESGRFDEEIELPHGLNALEFTVENRFGKVARRMRHVVVE